MSAGGTFGTLSSFRLTLPTVNGVFVVHVRLLSGKPINPGLAARLQDGPTAELRSRVRYSSQVKLDVQPGVTSPLTHLGRKGQQRETRTSVGRMSMTVVNW